MDSRIVRVTLPNVYSFDGLSTDILAVCEIHYKEVPYYDTPFGRTWGMAVSSVDIEECLFLLFMNDDQVPFDSISHSPDERETKMIRNEALNVAFRTSS